MFIRDNEDFKPRDRSQNPTQQEIDIITSKKIDAYVAVGFDPSQGDANIKWDAKKLKHTKKTEILVLRKRIFGYAYQPYIPSQHGSNKEDFESITAKNYCTTRSGALTAYKKWLKEKNNPTSNSKTVTIPPIPRIPTQTEIDILFSPSIDAYVEEGFDLRKGDANEKHDPYKHENDTKILVLKKKIFGYGYEPYKPSQHGTNKEDFKSIKVKNYRETRSGARKVYKEWLVENNITDSSIATTSSKSRIPTQEEIAIITTTKIDAYVSVGFDPSKGDDNEKYNSPKNCREDQILVLKNRIFGNAFEPYIPSKHGTNPKAIKSITVSYYNTARYRAVKAYELWKNNNTISTSINTSTSDSPSITTTTTTTTTTSSPDATTSGREVVSVGPPALLRGMPVSNPNTLFSTPSASHPSNQYIGPKTFNPIILINNYESPSETKEQGTDHSVAASQTIDTPQQRKRTANNSVLNSTPSITRSSFSLLQEIAEAAVLKDPTEPKRLRPNE